MKKKLLFLLLSLLMTGTAFARCIFYIDDFTVMPEQLGTEIDLCIKAEFSARLNSWILDLTYPEGITPVDAYLGDDGYITYLNASGNTRICTPTFLYNNDYTRFMAIATDAGYWYDPDDELTSYGAVKWEAGTYEEMIILRVEVSADFQGGKIIMNTSCGSGSDTRGGTIRDNGDQNVTFTCECNISGNSPEAYACYTPSNTTLTFYYDNLRSTRPGTTYDLNEGYDFPGWYSDGSNSSVTQAVFDPSFADARPTTTCGWFNNMKKLETITGMEYLNTSQVTKMSYMFYFCTSLTSLDLSNFNTANVTDMSRMFYQCRMTSLDLSNFNTANVTSMDYMFNYCLNLISLDVSGFNTAKVTDMEGMFNRCSSLTTIYGGDGWITSAVENSRMMFYYCTSLVGGQGTTYDVNHIDASYAHIDGGPSNPGYFTEKVDFVRGDVNGDNDVSIADVTTLIDYLLSGDASAINTDAADCNQDNDVSIADVTALIDYLLSGAWN